jgi:hypothetical protein
MAAKPNSHGCLMKYASLLAMALSGVAFSGCATPSEPRDSVAAPMSSDQNEGCYIDIFEDEDFDDDSLRVHGPAEYSGLEHLGGHDWGDRIASVRTGPKCWALMYADKGFDDTRNVIGPGSVISNLGDMEDEIESMKLFDHAP